LTELPIFEKLQEVLEAVLHGVLSRGLRCLGQGSLDAQVINLCELQVIQSCHDLRILLGDESGFFILLAFITTLEFVFVRQNLMVVETVAGEKAVVDFHQIALNGFSLVTLWFFNGALDEAGPIASFLFQKLVQTVEVFCLV